MTMHSRGRGAGDLTRAKRRFDQWRRSGRRGRLPNELWTLAAETASKHGVEATAEQLRVDPQRLGQWLDRLGLTASENRQQPAATEHHPPDPTFVELAPIPLAPSTQCQLEVKETSGRKLRIVLSGDAVAQAPRLLAEIHREAPR